MEYLEKVNKGKDMDSGVVRELVNKCNETLTIISENLWITGKVLKGWRKVKVILISKKRKEEQSW